MLSEEGLGRVYVRVGFLGSLLSLASEITCSSRENMSSESNFMCPVPNKLHKVPRESSSGSVKGIVISMQSHQNHLTALYKALSKSGAVCGTAVVGGR